MNQRLLQEVLGSTRLPTPPAIAMQIIEMTDDPNVTPADLTKLVQADSALSAKILKTVNSAFYGLATPAATIERAQIMLGLNAIKTLTLGFSLVQTLADTDGHTFDYVAYWKRSVYAAACAKTIAARTRSMEPEEALLGGLLQDVGMVVLHRTLGDDYDEIISQAAGRHNELSRLELSKLELTHAVVGATLAERWRFPASLIAPIRFHEQPTAAPKAQQAPVRCIGLASLAASALTEEDPAKLLRQFFSRIRTWFALEEAEAESIIDEAASGAREFAKLLDVETGAPANVQGLLESAKEKLVDLNLDHQIADAVGSLKQRQMVDALTGIPSRRAFLAMLNEAYNASSDAEGVLTVGTLDVDAFRAINDEHGREVGDCILMEIATRLETAFKKNGGSVARTGGETFGVLMPGVDGRAAAKICSQIIEEFKAVPIEPMGPGTEPALSLSVRVGITTLTSENHAAFATPLNLLNASEKALEAARSAGGNAVRAFIPQTRAAA